MNKNKLLLILLGTGIFIGIGLSVWTFFKVPANINATHMEKKDIELNEKVEETTGMKQEEIDKLTKDEKEGLVYGEIKTYSDGKFRLQNGKEEYPEMDARNLLNELVNHAEVASYDKIISEVKSKIEKYNFTEGTNLTIASMYHDASLMVTTLTVPEFQAGKLAKGMKDPQMMVIGTLMLPEKPRRTVITDKNSLSPIFEGAVKIKSHETLKGDTTEPNAVKAFNSTVGAEFIHKIEIELEGKNNLYAYVLEYRNATLEFYGLYAPEGKQYHYQDIKFWENIDNAYEKNSN